ncbi:uncharacterized protein LOC106011082 [Aplysia californica]|uniref:Uncharacterized protein LOC106011082 n=1 Tax=Aplysia californica TaxID=6500 RepID=A0ABM0ZUT9_APLCA|nr:uncharacterized protein LOC106011082 [Aplysia californica]
MVTINAVDQCEADIVSCLFMVMGRVMMHGDTDEKLLAYARSAPVDELCRILESGSHCAQYALDTSCVSQDVDREVYAYMAGVNYACSPEGRQMMATVQQSPCLQDVSLYHQMSRAERNCTSRQREAVDSLTTEGGKGKETPADPDVVCPIIEEMENCMTTNIISVCGATFGQLMDNIVAVMGPSQYGVDCVERRRRESTFARRTLWSLLGQYKERILG